MENVAPGLHPREDELIAHYYSCAEPESATGDHLAACGNAARL
jgi:hypothetical protein